MIVKLKFEKTILGKLIFYLSSQAVKVSMHWFPSSEHALLDSSADIKILKPEDKSNYFWWVNFELSGSCTKNKKISADKLKRILFGQIGYFANLDSSSWEEDTIKEPDCEPYCVDDAWPILASDASIREYMIDFDTTELPQGHWFRTVLENKFSQDIQLFLKERKRCFIT